MSSSVRGLVFCVPLLCAACGGGGGDGGSDPGQVAASVTISPVEPDTLFAQGATVDLDATVRDQQNAVMNNAAVTWTTSNAGVAAVNGGTGVVTAGAAGNTAQSASITVTVTGANGVTASVPVRVRQRLASLDLPATATVAAGATLALAATPRDAGGNAIAGMGGIAWGSAATGIATVNPATGVVTGVAAGSAKIGATLAADGGTRTDTTVVTVTAVGGAATVNTVGSTFSPQSVTINRTGSVTFNLGIGHDLTFNAGNPAAITGMALCAAGICSSDKTFNTAGTYGFHCSIHGSPGNGMFGSVVVNP